MNVSEDQLASWSQAPSETEDQKCLTAISAVGDALRARFGNSVKLIRQGSHTNRTNIRADSDVDVVALHTGYYFGDTAFLSAADKSRYEQNFVAADYSFAQYKNDVEQALRSVFGDAVNRRNKCLRVNGGWNRTTADVVPAYEHKRFSTYQSVSALGIEFVTDQGARIVSFPEQHYANGVRKNDDTRRVFKAAVRILKHVRNRLAEQRIIVPDSMSSYFVECLVWNVPNDGFGKSTWREVVESVTGKIWNDMRNPSIATNYAEVSDLHWLLRGGTRTAQQAEEFMLQAWRHVTQ